VTTAHIFWLRMKKETSIKRAGFFYPPSSFVGPIGHPSLKMWLALLESIFMREFSRIRTGIKELQYLWKGEDDENGGLFPGGGERAAR
jgi:hypothetical protein